ncbi:MAG TPA: hypothetical protein VFF13_05650, partial [archaeon]|nr:hypothetical protein [archaeon]
MERKLFFAVILATVLLAPNIFGANTFYLRGTSSTITIDSTTYNQLIPFPPNSSAAKTIITKTTQTGTHEFASWLSGEIGSLTGTSFTASGAAFLYLPKFGITGGSGEYRWKLYDYTSGTQTEQLVATSA